MNNSYGRYDLDDDCIISGNRITKNGHGSITSGAKHNIVSGNTITINEYGFFGTVDHITICGENIINNTFCESFLMYSTDNNISGNTITNNRNATAENVPRT